MADKNALAQDEQIREMNAKLAAQEGFDAEVEFDEREAAGDEEAESGR